MKKEFYEIIFKCMNQKGIGFTRKLYIDNGSDAEPTKVADYTIK